MKKSSIHVHFSTLSCHACKKLRELMRKISLNDVCTHSHFPLTSYTLQFSENWFTIKLKKLCKSHSHLFLISHLCEKFENQIKKTCHIIFVQVLDFQSRKIHAVRIIYDNNFFYYGKPISNLIYLLSFRHQSKFSIKGLSSNCFQPMHIGLNFGRNS